ncbi:hypothetical protein, partial [Micromonospora sp. KC207]|uniref:hypothetical protein n=1 Tax=Micromonospora sp. KC207 TaxID=2530377 RepID=UPI001FB821CC
MMRSDRVRAVLRATAASHQPDRAAILARIQRGQAAFDPSPATRPTRRGVAVRAAGMAATVATVLGLGVVVTWAAVGHEATPPPVHMPSPMA